MAPNAQLTNALSLITFDVYSALLDINQGLAEAASEVTTLPIDTVLPAVKVWRIKQMERAAANSFKRRSDFVSRLHETGSALHQPTVLHSDSTMPARSRSSSRGIRYRFGQKPTTPLPIARTQATTSLSFQTATRTCSRR